MGLPNEPMECQFVGMDRTGSQWNVSLLAWTGQGANGMSVCWHGQDRPEAQGFCTDRVWRLELTLGCHHVSNLGS